MFFSFFKTKRSRDPQLAKQLYDNFNKTSMGPFYYNTTSFKDG